MGIDYQDRRLPKYGPSAEELRAMARLLPGGAKDLVSLRGRHWKAQGVDIETLAEDEVLERILKDPLSLRRPILWQGDRLLLGYSAKSYEGLR